MKICVSTYSYGSYLRDEKLGIYGCIDHAAGEGFDGIEFVEGGWQDARQGDADGAERIKEHCERAGITPVAFLVGADFINRGGSDGREEIARVRSLVDTAAALGCTMLRHDVTGGLPADRKLGRSFDALLPKLAERIREVTKYAEQKGIRTMSENHGFFAQDSDRIEKLINAVGHPNYGALIDCGNFLCARRGADARRRHPGAVCLPRTRKGLSPQIGHGDRSRGRLVPLARRELPQRHRHRSR